jgi:hypothetical protein
MKRNISTNALDILPDSIILNNVSIPQMIQCFTNKKSIDIDTAICLITPPDIFSSSSESEKISCEKTQSDTQSDARCKRVRRKELNNDHDSS